MADKPCNSKEGSSGIVARSPTFYLPSQSADIPIAVVAARKRRGNLFPTHPWKGDICELLRIDATSLVLTFMWVPQAHTQVASRQAPENGPKTLLEAVNGTDAGQVNEGKSDDERLDPDRPHFPEATTTVGKDRVMLESGYTFMRKDSSFLSHSYPRACFASECLPTGSNFDSGRTFSTKKKR